MTLYVSGMLIRAFALRGLIFGFAVTAGLAERWLDPDSPERQTMVSASVSTLALCLALGGAGGRGKQCPCGRGTACGQAPILAGAEAGVARTRPAALHNLGHAAGRRTAGIGFGTWRALMFGGGLGRLAARRAAGARRCGVDNCRSAPGQTQGGPAAQALKTGAGARMRHTWWHERTPARIVRR